MPLGQAKPRDIGCFASGRSRTSRPSSTVATRPHSGSQIRQYVTRSSVAMPPIVSSRFAGVAEVVWGNRPF